MTHKDIENTILDSIDSDSHAIKSKDTARLVIDGNKVIGSQHVPGLNVNVKELKDGVDVSIHLEDNTIINKPVHLCFGVVPEKGIQRIILNGVIGKYSKVKIFGHCTFPNAIDVLHKMEGNIHVMEGADYSYMERHIHSESGGIKVIPVTKVQVDENAHFNTEFELLKGRVGIIDIDYYIKAGKNALVDMIARIDGKKSDYIKISESAELNGAYAKGVLTSKVAVRDQAKAEIYNKIIANAPYSRGHVDCKEIVKDHGVAMAYPIVDVRNPKAHVTHEAVVGDVDKKQLETLMARGLEEDDASELIIQGILS
jgi:hypothetical protein